MTCGVVRRTSLSQGASGRLVDPYLDCHTSQIAFPLTKHTRAGAELTQNDML